MKSIFVLILVIFITSEGHAQKRRPKIPPPPPALPPPPKPFLPVNEKMEADPLTERVVTFWTDTIYSKTDSSFQVELRYFSPSGLGKARLAKQIYLFPKQYTKDSLVQNGRVFLPIRETHYQDGEYVYSSIPAKTAESVTFTDDKTKIRTKFVIKWKGTGADREILELVDATEKIVWKLGEPPAFAPVGY